jgi:hypothetical protein
MTHIAEDLKREKKIADKLHFDFITIPKAAGLTDGQGDRMSLC